MSLTRMMNTSWMSVLCGMLVMSTLSASADSPDGSGSADVDMLSSAEVESVELFESLAAATEGHEKCRRLARAVRSWRDQEGARLAALLAEVPRASALEPEQRAELDVRLEAAFQTIGVSLTPCAEHPATVEAFTEVGALLVQAKPAVTEAPGEAGELRWGASCAGLFEAVSSRCDGAGAEDARCVRLRETVEGFRASGLEYGQSMVEQLEPVCAQALSSLSSEGHSQR